MSAAIKHGKSETRFEIDSATLAALEELKSKFGVTTNAERIRRAILERRLLVL